MGSKATKWPAKEPETPDMPEHLEPWVPVVDLPEGTVHRQQDGSYLFRHTETDIAGPEPRVLYDVSFGSDNPDRGVLFVRDPKNAGTAAASTAIIPVPLPKTT